MKLQLFYEIRLSFINIVKHYNDVSELKLYASFNIINYILIKMCVKYKLVIQIIIRSSNISML